MVKCVNCDNEMRGEQYCLHCMHKSIAERTLTPRILRDLKQLKFPVEPFLSDLQSLLSFKNDNKGLFLTGSVGSGKTIYAAHLLMESFTFKSAYKSRLFVTVPELLQRLRSSYSDKSDMEKQIVENYSMAELLIMDDLGVEKTTDWVFQILYLILNYRYEHLLPTVFTSNLSLEELTVKFGDARIPSRISAMCEVRVFDGESLRI